MPALVRGGCSISSDLLLQARRERIEFLLRDHFLAVSADHGPNTRSESHSDIIGKGEEHKGKGWGDVLFVEGPANIAEGDALGVLDGCAPRTVLGDDDDLLYAGHRRGLFLRSEGGVSVARFMVVPASLAYMCERRTKRSKKGIRHKKGRSPPVERLKISWKDSLVLARMGLSSSSVPRRYKSVWVRTGPSKREWRI